MSALLAPSSFQANSNINRPSSNNSITSGNGDGMSFDSTLQTQTKALNQNNSEQNNQAPKTIKSHELLGTIWSMQGNQNLSTQTTPISSKIKFSSSSVSAESTDSVITTDTSGALPTIPSQDLLAMIWAMQNGTNAPSATFIPTASETIINTDAAASIEASIAENTSLLLASTEIDQTILKSPPDQNLTTTQVSFTNNNAPISATIPTYQINPSVNESGWDAAISQRVVWMASQNIQSATLNINPENLGPLQIQIQVDNNQLANVQFFSAQPEVRLALQNSMPMLSQMLEQTGIQLGQSDVSSQSFGSSQQQQKSNFNTLVNEQIKLDSASTTVTSATPISSGNGLLNIYA